ncbi:hypothetical protein [Eudoraea adriatica]|uniref:hypothetical protein n=1 Tax=Eudoraea adriatica TaxID=446681 RepID=UPI000369C24C|nr:hypothetical protein [Eudoraea adriatica]
MKEQSHCDHFTVTYKDKDGKDRLVLFFDSGKVTQVRVHLGVKQENVKSCFMAYSNTHFIKSPIVFMEKEFYRDGGLIQEYYTDGVLDSYFETECKRSFEILRGFSSSGTLFYTQVTYKNPKGKPYVCYEKVDDDPSFYRRINSEGAHSEKCFNTFAECIRYHGEPIL